MKKTGLAIIFLLLLGLGACNTGIRSTDDGEKKEVFDSIHGDHDHDAHLVP